MKIVIADDDALYRALLSQMLGELGHAVVAAASGPEAVELVRREQPDAVVLDFLMPRMSGLDVLRAIRAGGRRVPAVLLTAITDGSIRAVGGADAPDAILEKPVRKKDLERALARALRAPCGSSARC